MIKLSKGNAADTAIVNRLDALCKVSGKTLKLKEVKRLRSDEAASAIYYGDVVVPVATAVENSRHTYNQDNFLAADGKTLHPWFGTYMAACTAYESIFGEKAPSEWQPPHLSLERAELARNCAHAACEHPGEVSQIEFSTPDADWFTNQNGWHEIRPYTLPEALRMADGRPVATPEQWYDERRPELLELFDTEMFGKAPGAVEGTTYSILEEDEEALGGKAIRRQVKIDFHRNGQFIQVLMYLPKGAEGKVPVFVGLNFDGNHTVSADPGILIPENTGRYGVYPEAGRGSQASRWPIEEIIGRGYGVVTFHKSDLDPDYDDGFSNGVTPFIYRDGQEYPDPDQWGTISAWAWGISRVMDYLECDPDVDAGRVAAIGHSRLGKTALLAAARDQRIAMAISNSSGCGGAALSRRVYGETIQAITRYFPHWFCGNFFKYARHEDELPFDQHEFLALIAPRPLYVASAEVDIWADPTGERLSLQHARKVYDFLGVGQSKTAYHIREGVHELTLEDWLHYLDFADRNL